MNAQKIIFIVSLVLFFLLFLTLPVRDAVFKKKSGEKLMELKNPGVFKSILIYFLAFVLIILTQIRHFQVWSQLILCGCALLGDELAMKDLAAAGKSGIYSNGIMVNGNFITFESILCMPVLQLPAEEQEHYDKTSLIVTTTKKPEIALLFADEEECAAATAKILELKPELKTW